ncbi:MAG: hypothetical protein PHF63_00950 [Herbinix sp.]|nr:hypothetical protein [Herbinix sp.]
MAIKEYSKKEMKEMKISLIMMSSKEFVKKFCQKEDPSKLKQFQFILISENIRTEGRYKNLDAAKALLPPPHILHEFVENGYSKEYKEKYTEYLNSVELQPIIWAIVKMLIGNNNVVLMCSEDEMEYKYLKLILKYLKKKYFIEGYSYKEFKDTNKPNSIVDPKKTLRVVYKVYHTLETKGDPTMYATPNLKKIKKKLSALSHKDIKKMAKKKGIKKYDELDKDELVDKIMSRLKKENAK